MSSFDGCESSEEFSGTARSYSGALSSSSFGNDIITAASSPSGNEPNMPLVSVEMPVNMDDTTEEEDDLIVSKTCKLNYYYIHRQ